MNATILDIAAEVPRQTLLDRVAAYERDAILVALATNRGSQAAAARALGIPVHMLSHRLEKHGLLEPLREARRARSRRARGARPAATLETSV